jgi:hypothetical protein
VSRPNVIGFAVIVLAGTSCPAAQTGAASLPRVREAAAEPLRLAHPNEPPAAMVLLDRSELVENAGQWLRDFVRQTSGSELPVSGPDRLRAGGAAIVAAVGQQHPLVQRLVAEGRLRVEPQVGEQGFVIQRIDDVAAGRLLVCWSPTALGCRYGLLEILRSLRVAGGSIETALGRVVERPHFPIRICYVNFAEHLQNAYNPNLLFPTAVNCWSRTDWERFIDMISAFRYNDFEFWLVPTLFSPEALKGGKIQVDFAATMNHVIAYGKRRGVAVHPIQAVNCVGAAWHSHCPNKPQEKKEILALWDHWSNALRGNQYWGFFPGDPGGCTQNGCTAETFVDLCLELTQVVRRNNPDATIEIGTWGDPFAGWGVPLWTGKPPRAASAMEYFLGKLPQFPPGTIASINLGFSPDCLASHGGDGKPYARRAAATNPVLTWDYSVTEGEGTVIPHCRARRMFARRQEEASLGCYSGGICYTMTPGLNCLSIFCCAEAYWNPQLQPEAVLADYGRLVFGEPLASVGPLLEEFEVIPDWGYYPPFPYSPTRLRESMTRLLPLLEKVDVTREPRLPLQPGIRRYRDELLFFAKLFRDCGTAAAALEEATKLAADAGRAKPSAPGSLTIDELGQMAAAKEVFLQQARLRQLVAEVRGVDLRALRKSYWNRVYGIYDVAPHPTDPRAQGATQTLFQRFHYDAAVVHEPSTLEKSLRATGKPFLLLDLGAPISERGWQLSGWTPPAEYQGETWRASFEQPGVAARDDFRDDGYAYLIVRLTEGPRGGGKTIAVNGQTVARFERTGPPVDVKREWWVTRCYPLPRDILKPGRLEICFTESGVAIDSVALATAPVPNSE